MKLKKGANPIGTRHKALMQSGNVRTLVTYKVHHVTGNTPGIPSEGVVIWAVIDGKTAHPVDNFIILPIDEFAASFKPVTEADKFWKEEKSDVEIQSEEI